MKKAKKFFIILFLFIIYILFSISSYANIVSKNISNSVFRLHVIANSDSDEDQSLKYAVRDNLIEYMNSFSSSISTKEDAINIVSKNLDAFKTIAQNTVYNLGFDYDVMVELGNFDFPTKNYGDIYLPSGFYDALKVKIGKASGKNWWCVMFPNLCFIDPTNTTVPDESKHSLKSALPEEEYSLISSEDLQYTFKFKLVELFENAKITLAKK